MKPERILILDKTRIELKLNRMAYQIWEHNSNATEITLVGIANGGAAVAKNLAKRLEKISKLKVTLSDLRINKKNPMSEKITVTIPDEIRGKSVVLVDDVANSGKTLLYALQPLLELNLSKIMIAVLVDRKHKIFPVSPDIVGHSIATTLQDNIIVEIKDGTIDAAYIE